MSKISKASPQQLGFDGMDTALEWHKTQAELYAGLDHVRQSPRLSGSVEMIVCRPAVGERRILPQGHLDAALGLRGDNWKQRGYRKAADGAAQLDMQLNLMNARAIDLIAGSRERWPLAGDQFFVELDLSYDHLPPGTLLEIGTAVIQVTAEPHLGCRKFQQRYGKAAAQFVNSDAGKALNLRGINARIVEGGVVLPGDTIRTLTQSNLLQENPHE